MKPVPLTQTSLFFYGHKSQQSAKRSNRWRAIFLNFREPSAKNQNFFLCLDDSSGRQSTWDSINIKRSASVSDQLENVTNDLVSWSAIRRRMSRSAMHRNDAKKNKNDKKKGMLSPQDWYFEGKPESAVVHWPVPPPPGPSCACAWTCLAMLSFASFSATLPTLHFYHFSFCSRESCVSSNIFRISDIFRWVFFKNNFFIRSGPFYLIFFCAKVSIGRRISFAATFEINKHNKECKRCQPVCWNYHFSSSIIL